MLNEENNQTISTTLKLQETIDNWAKSHGNLNKILDAKIPHQCKKILGGDIDGAVNILKLTKPEENLLNQNDLSSDFKTRFISHSFITQTIVDKHYVSNVDGVTMCKTRLSALDPSKLNPEREYESPST